MIDIKALRENPARFEESALRRGKSIDTARIIELDAKVRALTSEIELIAAEKNAASDRIALLEGTEKQEAITEMRSLSNRANDLESKRQPLRDELQTMLYNIPNVLADDVPDGTDESENVELRRVGEPPKFTFTPKDHVDIGKRLGIIELDMASQVSGARFSYLKGAAADLQLAIMNLVRDTLTNEDILKTIIKENNLSVSSKPFTFVFPPVMIKPEPYRQMGRLSAEVEDERYYLAKDNLYLIGSAEHTLGPLHMNEIIDEDRLPIRYIGYSTAFRREAGSHGKDTRGIIRQHQFDKLEMESFTDANSSLEEQNFFVAIQEYLLQQLDLPYRVMMICTGDIGTPDARQIDIETWIPSQNTFRETHTSDLMTDYQSRRLNTRYRTEGRTEFVHMNDATAFAIGRIIVAILENNQLEDGSVRVPDALVRYTGYDHIVGDV